MAGGSEVPPTPRAPGEGSELCLRVYGLGYCGLGLGAWPLQVEGWRFRLQRAVLFAAGFGESALKLVLRYIGSLAEREKMTM